jgi:hypothetical protein
LAAEAFTVNRVVPVIGDMEIEGPAVSFILASICSSESEEFITLTVAKATECFVQPPMNTQKNAIRREVIWRFIGYG